jgi:hypothetical protein
MWFRLIARLIFMNHHIYSACFFSYPFLHGPHSLPHHRDSKRPPLEWLLLGPLKGGHGLADARSSAFRPRLHHPSTGRFHLLGTRKSSRHPLQRPDQTEALPERPNRPSQSTKTTTMNRQLRQSDPRTRPLSVQQIQTSMDSCNRLFDPVRRHQAPHNLSGSVRMLGMSLKTS